MEELYSIMKDLLEVEYAQKSLLHVLETLEAAYSEQDQFDAKMAVNHAKNSIRSIQEEMRAAINRLDHYIVAASGKK